MPARLDRRPCRSLRGSRRWKAAIEPVGDCRMEEGCGIHDIRRCRVLLTACLEGHRISAFSGPRINPSHAASLSGERQPITMACARHVGSPMAKCYGNEEIELIGDQDRMRLEAERLRHQISYNYNSSAFYRTKLESAGVRPDQIRDARDLARIPFMEKSEIAESQRDGDLLGVNQCAPLERIVRVQATGGTTGQPMRIGLTRQDIADYCEMGARALWAMGCRPGDIVFECMNYNLYAGGVSDHMNFETLRAATIPYGVGHSEQLIRMMAGLKSDLAIWATPSYAIRLSEVAREAGIAPRT